VVQSKACQTCDLDVRVVIVRTDADNVTLSAPVTWETDAQGNTGRTFSWYKTRCGTGATDGWIDVSAATVKVFRWQFEQGDIDGLEARLECRTANLDQQPTVVFPGVATADCGAGTVESGYCRYATAGITGRYDIRDENPWASCRIGFKYQSSDASDTSAELVTNGTFTGNANGWTLGAGGGAPDWAYSSNTVTHGDGGGVDALEPSTPITVVAGHVYQVAFTLSSWSAGTVTPTIGSTVGTAFGEDGTSTQTITAADDGNLLLTPTDTLVTVLDGVTVVDITGANRERFSASVTLGRQ
jgi:hypothetical protein